MDTLSTFLQRPATGGKNCDGLYDEEYYYDLTNLRMRYGLDASIVEAFTLFYLGFTLEQARDGLALLRASGVTDETTFAEGAIESARSSARRFEV
jgi:hypothetical protein